MFLPKDKITYKWLDEGVSKIMPKILRGTAWREHRYQGYFEAVFYSPKDTPYLVRYWKEVEMFEVFRLVHRIERELL